MEFRNLYSFLRVAELGNFTKAAEEMNYAQSTVTTQIQQLEKELGVPLFERIGKKSILTVYGEHLVVYANQILQKVEEIKCLAEPDPKKAQGTLRIGAAESLMSSILMSIISAFRDKYPNIKLFIRLGITAELIGLLQRNEVDLIFTMGDHWDTKDCECPVQHLESAVFVASEVNALSQRESIKMEEILREHLILTGEKTILYKKLNKYALDLKVQLNPSIITDSAKAIIDLVDQNLGISLLPEYMVKCNMFSDNYNLKVLKVEDFSMAFYTRVFYHKNKWVTPYMWEFIKLIEDYWKVFDQNIQIQ